MDGLAQVVVRTAGQLGLERRKRDVQIFRGVKRGDELAFAVEALGGIRQRHARGQERRDLGEKRGVGGDAICEHRPCRDDVALASPAAVFADVFASTVGFRSWIACPRLSCSDPIISALRSDERDAEVLRGVERGDELALVLNPLAASASVMFGAAAA